MRKWVSQYRRPPRPNMPLVCCPLWCLPVWSRHHTPPPSWFAVQFAASTADRGLRSRKRRAGGVVGGLGSGWVGGCVAPVMLRCLPDQQAQMSLALAQWLADPQRLKKKTLPPTTSWLATVKTSQTTQDYLTVTSPVGDTWRWFFGGVLHQVTSNNQHNKSNSIK